MRDDLIGELRSKQQIFGIHLTGKAEATLHKFHELVKRHNTLLHLVAPCTAEEFATRHILESLTMLEYLPQGAKFVDVGAGAGLPSIPCLIARDDLKATLIESTVKKAKFLEHAIDGLGLKERANVVNRQFEEAEPGDAQFVTCRALDKFTAKLPRLIKWSKGRRLLFFGGPVLSAGMQKHGLPLEKRLLPRSERRYLFVTGSN